MPDYGITTAGVSIPRQVDYLDEIDASYFDDTQIALDSTNSDNANQVLVRLVNYVAAILEDIGEQAQATVDILDVDNASGRQLVSLATIRGVPVKEESKGTVTITCAGDPGTALLEDQVIVQGGGRGGVLARWILTETLTIGAGGTADAVFECEEAGAIPADAGVITGIVTPIAGLNSVTNATAAAQGLDGDTDGSLRLRMRQAGNSRAGCGVPGIRSRIIDLAFVQACTIIANGDSEPKLVQGVQLPANSYLCVVMPTQLTTAQEQEILGVLYDSVLGTGRTVGTDVDGEVTNLADGTSWPVSFDYGEDLALTVSVTLTALPGAAVSEARKLLGIAINGDPGDETDAGLFPFALGDPLRRLTIQKLAEDTGVVDEISDLRIEGVAADYDPTIKQRISSITVVVNGVAA